jgi:hypothetical protein
MKLGKYDSLVAKNKAARFLLTSIGEMDQLMADEGIDFDYSGDNPYSEGTIEYNAFRITSSEHASLEALKNE